MIAIATIEIDDERGIAIIRCPDERILAALKTGFREPQGIAAVELQVAIKQRPIQKSAMRPWPPGNMDPE